MAYIRREKRSVFERAKHLLARLGIGMPRAVGRYIVGVDVDTIIDETFAAVALHTHQQRVGRDHMYAVIAVVGNKHYVVFPRARVGSSDIFDEFVDGGASLVDRLNRHTTDSDVEFAGTRRNVGIVFQNAENVVGVETRRLRGNVVRLPSQEHRIVKAASFRSQTAIVVDTSTKEEDVTESVNALFGKRLSAFPEHFRQLTISHSVGGSRRKFVVYGTVVDNYYLKTVDRSMEFGNTFGLGGKFFGRDDNHRRRFRTVQVLVRHHADIFRRREC